MNKVIYPQPTQTSKRWKPKFIIAITAIAIIVIILIGLTTYEGLFGNKQQPATSQNYNSEVIVKITEKGFEPATISVSKNTTVKWINEEEYEIEIASNPYGDHSNLPSLKSSVFRGGESYSYKFDSSGTFGYHNHLQPTQNGVVVVSE